MHYQDIFNSIFNKTDLMLVYFFINSAELDEFNLIQN